MFLLSSTRTLTPHSFVRQMPLPRLRFAHRVACIAGLALAPLPAVQAQYKVLFVGNSFTMGDRVDGNGADDVSVPAIFQALAVADGQPEPDVMSTAVGGKDFQWHATSQEAINLTPEAIALGDWTHIVLQNYSTEPTHIVDGSHSIADHLTYGGGLYDDAMLSALNPKPKVILYETWARANVNSIYTGASTNTTFIDPDEFQNELWFNYRRLADLLNQDPDNAANPAVKLGPVGDAWMSAGGMLPPGSSDFIDLFAVDNYHGNDSGYYLSAAVLYARIYGASPVGLSQQPAVQNLGLALNSPGFLEQVAWAIVSSQDDPLATYLIDFGAAGTPTGHGAAPDDAVYYWNNVTTAIGTLASGTLANLVQANNAASSVGFAVINPFAGGNSNGTQNSTLFPANVTRDSLYGNTEAFNNLSNVFPSFKLTGLTTSRVYTLTFHASRTGTLSGESRETKYTVTGTTTDFTTLDAANNANNSATVFGIAPTNGGEVTVAITPGPGNNNSSHFTHLGALRVEEHESESSPVAFTQEPDSQEVEEGQPVTFTAIVQGSPPYTSVWTKNGTTIAGATQLSYTIPSTTLAMNGDVFTITVSNAATPGGVTSGEATLTVVASTPVTQTLLVDFGDPGTTTIHGGAPANDPNFYWNNLTTTPGTTPGAQLTNLVTKQNGSTSVGLTMLNRFSGRNPNGTTSSSQFPGNATGDSLFGDATFPTPGFKLTGLNANATFTFTFFASRMKDVGEVPPVNRETRYTVQGAGTAAFVTLNPTDNVNSSGSISGIAPTAGGEIAISLAAGSNNNSSSQFTYLGVMQVDMYPGLAPDSTITAPAGNVTITAGQSVSFGGSGSDPDNHTPLTYLWDFGTSGIASSGVQNPGLRQFNTAGVFTVSFTVTDALGLADPSPATRTITVNPVNQAPDGTIPMPAGNVTITAGQSVSFSGSGSDPDNHTPLTHLWTFGTGSGIANSTAQNPGSVQFNNPGTFTVSFTVTDSLGLADPTPATRTVTVNASGQSAFGGTPWPVDATIEAEAYDVGGPGVAYHDTTVGNIGEAYRADNVDLEVCAEGGFNVGWTATNEWLEYTIAVAAAGMHVIDLRTATPSSGRLVSVTIDSAAAGSITAPTTGGWQTFQTSTTSGVNLSAGPHVVRVTFPSGSVNLNWLRVRSVSAPNQAPDGTIATPASNVTITAGQSVSFSGSGSDPDNHTPLTYHWNFGSGSGIADSPAQNPGSRQFNNPGAFTVSFIVTDSLGLADPTPATRTVTVNASGQSAFGGTPWPVDATIEAEAYDVGGPGVAYHDTTVGNIGGAYRADNVDLEVCAEGGFNVGWTATNEWLEYTIAVAAAGMHVIDLRTATPSSGRLVSVTIDSAAAGSITAPTTGGWQAFQTSTTSGVNLSAGPHVVRVTFPSGSVNLNWLRVRSVSAPNQAPDRTIATPAGNVTITAGQSVSFGGSGSDPDNHTPLTYHWNFGSGSGIADSPAQNPGSRQFNNPGAFTVSFIVTDSLGLADPTPATRTVTVNASGQSAFGGTPWAVGATIEAENYDLGGKGVAYSDTTAGNAGGKYRTDDVDIQACNEGGFNIGWTVANEWLEYTIEVANAGVHEVDLRMATAGTGRSVSVAIDSGWVGSLALPHTGGWQSFQTFTTGAVNLSAGPHVVRVTFPSGSVNLNWLKIRRPAALN